jgi:hypothetical protein
VKDCCRSFGPIRFSILWDSFLRLGICMRRQEGTLGDRFTFKLNFVRISPLYVDNMKLLQL